MSNKALAQAVFDGSTGGQVSGSVAGATIDVSQGTRAGNNVFHSFSSFSIPTGQSVTFTDTTPTTPVQNIINRVTGTSITEINGTLASSVAGADFYLINPNGIVIGPRSDGFASGSTINVPAGFHLSTAPELRFNDAVIMLTNSGASSFSSAAPTAYGFTGVKAEAITFSGMFDGNNLASSSLVAGDIFLGGTLNTRDGNVSVIAVHGESIVNLDNTVTQGHNFQFGNIEISNGGIVMGSCRCPTTMPSGIFLHGASITMDNAVIRANGSKTSTEGNNTGDLLKVIASEKFSLNQSEITSAFTDLLEVSIVTPHLALDGSDMQLVTDSDFIVGASARANSVLIDSNFIELRRGSELNVGTISSGQNPGNVSIVTDLLSISGIDENGRKSAIRADNKSPVLPNTASGIVNINAREIEILSGGEITAVATGTGNAGSIRICCNARISISGEGSQIVGGTFANSSGSGGKVFISSESLQLSDGARMTVATEGTGAAGEINIRTGTFSAVDLNRPTGSPDSSATGIATVSGASGAPGAGGGRIAIEAGTFLLQDGAVVTTDTSGTAPAGTIDIRASEFVVSGTDAKLVSRAVGTSGGNAGDITIGAYNITFKDGATLSTFSQSGAGGNIKLDWNRVTTITGSNVTTEVRSGNLNSGNILFALEPLPDLGFEDEFLAFCGELLDIYKGLPKYDPDYDGPITLILGPGNDISCENSGGGFACRPPTPPDVTCIGRDCNQIDTTSTTYPSNPNTRFPVFTPASVVIVPERNVTTRCEGARQQSALIDSWSGRGEVEADPSSLAPAGLPGTPEAVVVASANRLCRS